MRLKTSKYTSAVLLLLCSMTQAHADGWGFVPEAAEWSAWPLHCRVQYSYINRGANDYGNFYPQSAIDDWRARVGDKTFVPLHHYCAAMIYLNRARLESDPKMRKHLIGNAVGDGYFAFSRADTDSMLYPNVAVTMAQARYENKETLEAINILKQTIASHPSRTEAYGVLAGIYRKQGELTQARDVLKQADVASEGSSAEVKYTLGLVQIELGEIDAAVISARDAYALGHPLPGLRRKLEKLGRSVPSVPALAPPPASAPQTTTAESPPAVVTLTTPQ